MFGLDELIATLGDGSSFPLVTAVGLLLGLRHATDPDHLAAVSTLIASDPEDGTSRAGRLGLAWGFGHATTLFLVGLPIVLFESYLPDPIQTGSEALVGIVIMALAVRLLIRWRRGRFHAHVHRHGDVEHRHLHPHEHSHHDHSHEPEARLGRSPVQAYGIGLIHGLGGTAGIGLLLLAGLRDPAEALAALAVFAAATAMSMAVLSAGLGYALARGPIAERAFALTPVLGVLTLAFGAWYALGAAGAVSYLL